MAGQSTVIATVKIDVGPDGIKFTMEGIDTDLANLIAAAYSYTAQPAQYRSFGTSDMVIKSNKVIQFVDPVPTDVPTFTG